VTDVEPANEIAETETPVTKQIKAEQITTDQIHQVTRRKFEVNRNKRKSAHNRSKSSSSKFLLLWLNVFPKNVLI
jgi:hypothetical protein